MARTTLLKPHLARRLQLSEGCIAATLSHAGMETMLAPQLHPGAAHRQTGDQQLPLKTIHLSQLALQPGHLGTTANIQGRPGLFQQRTGISKMVQPGGVFAIGVCVAALKRIQAEGMAHQPEPLNFIDLAGRAAQGCRHPLPSEGRQPRCPALVLERPGPMTQLPESPGETDPGLPIAQFMLDRTAHVGHSEGAEAVAGGGWVALQQRRPWLSF